MYVGSWLSGPCWDDYRADRLWQPAVAR